MKTLFNVMVMILLLADAFGLVGCAGQAAPAGEVATAVTSPSTYTLDTCVRFSTAVAGQTLPCHYGDRVSAFSCDVAEGLLVRGGGTCGVVPDSMERGAWLCMKVTCEKGVGR